jgi:hypothetical protein
VRKGKGGVTAKVRKSWLVFVLRLRQAVSHPFLLENLMKEEFTADDINWLIDELSKIQTRTPFVEQVGLWCEEQLRVQKSQPGSEEITTNERLGARFDMIPQLKRVEKAND